MNKKAAASVSFFLSLLSFLEEDLGVPGTMISRFGVDRGDRWPRDLLLLSTILSILARHLHNVPGNLWRLVEPDRL